MKRTPIRPGNRPLARRAALQRSSLRRHQTATAYELEYRRMARLVHIRSGGRCEVKYPHDCKGWAQPWPYHRKLRSQGGPNTLDNLLDCCATAHPNLIHISLPRHIAESVGLIVPRDRPIVPYDPEAYRDTP